MLLHIPTEYYPMQPTLSGLGAVCFIKVNPMVAFSNVGTRYAGTLKGNYVFAFVSKKESFPIEDKD